MNASTLDRFVRQAQAAALMMLPVLWMLMFSLHFRSFDEFLTYRSHYVAVPAAETVTHLIAAGNRWPMLHDPHQIGYLGLPLFVFVAFGLYAMGRLVWPMMAALGIALTVTGCLYLGGVFGLYTSLVRGLGDVDPRYTEGAIATFAAVTAERGAYGLTRSLAELALLGLAIQGLALWRAPQVPRWSPLLIVAGCGLFLAYWDVDNMMLAGSVCLLAGFVPVARGLRQMAVGPAGQGAERAGLTPPA